MLKLSPDLKMRMVIMVMVVVVVNVVVCVCGRGRGCVQIWPEYDNDDEKTFL